MTIDVLDKKGEKNGTVDLPTGIFDVKFNSDLVHQIYVSMMSNRRKTIAHTKGRGEVSGGGKKPWKQKGTGRARHGSIRSPIWKGGGVTFGPKKERNFEKKINRKMKHKAMLMVLSRKVKDNQLIIVDDLYTEKAKTKLMANIFNAIFKSSKLLKYNALVVTAMPDQTVIRSSKNLPKVQVLEAKNLNVIDLLDYKFLILTKDSIEKLINLNKEK
ncbi:50S ribosomal protein L4 [Candidatus Azambacteria bacterium]|nr:50S ribosomal protein L4 [Candidatus Azambacteria bacterium]